MGSRQLRILQILRAPVGGLFRHVRDITEGLAARGHAVGVVVDSLSADALTAPRLEQMRTAATLGIHSFPLPRLLGAGDVTTPLAIRRLARELGVEVLHGHGAKGGVAARLARQGGRCVALYTPHGGVLHFPPRSASGFLFRTVERLLLPSTDALAFESAFARDGFHRLIGRPSCPEKVIHNGLRAEEFTPVPLREGAADFVFIGEFRQLKGIDVLLEAVRGSRTRSGRPARLAMAGNGPELAAFSARRDALGLSAEVNLLGVRPAREALAWGRCVVVPSRKESLPYVVLEAAAAGRPLIATRVGGIPEIFGPTAPALVAPGDADALGTALQRFLDDPAPAEAEAARRLEHVREHFSATAMVSGIEALYLQALSPQEER